MKAGMKYLSRIFGTILFASVAPFAAAQDGYPRQAIKIVVPYPAGGTSDSVARVLAQGLSERLKQAVVVENKGGAATMPATAAVAKANPDGYTLMLTSTPLAINETLYKATLPYRTFDDLQPINVIASAPLLLIVHPSFKAKTMAELIAMAKAEPGKLTYGTSGNGGSGHLSMESIQLMTGTKFTHVPYRGSAPALQDLLGGQTNIMIDTLFLTKPHVEQGKARALAQLGAKRSRNGADIPTMDESGLKGFNISSWFILLAPAGTPKAIVDRLNAVSNEIINQPAVSEQFAKQGLELMGGTPQDAQKFLKEQVERFGSAVKAANIKPE